MPMTLPHIGEMLPLGSNAMPKASRARSWRCHRRPTKRLQKWRSAITCHLVRLVLATDCWASSLDHSDDVVNGLPAGSRSWIYALLARYRADGEAAFEPRSRRPGTCPRAIPDATAGLITELRKDLAERGPDAGPQTIAWHLKHHHQIRVSPATRDRVRSRCHTRCPPEITGSRRDPPAIACRIACVAHTHIHAFLGIFHRGWMAAMIDCVNSLLGEPNLARVVWVID